MSWEPESAIERACQTRFPAWTLYARAFSGNRQDADAVVRTAVEQALSGGAFSTEAEAHREILTSIRVAALRGRAPRDASSSSVLSQLQENPERATNTILSRVASLTRTQKRMVELAFLKRRPVSLDDAARILKMPPRKLEASVDRALTILAGGGSPEKRRLEPKRHQTLRELVQFVKGALTGDEARAVSSHARACQACGNRLGTMMALKATAAESTRPPRIPRSARRIAMGTAATAGLVGLALLTDVLLPNPWAEHATRGPVPRWFYDFFYGGERPARHSETSRGLELLVENELDDAIAVLEPVVDADDDLEASAYLGIAYYLRGDHSRGTVRLLEAGTGSHRAGRLARWYLANALLLRRDPSRARAHLEALAGVHDWFGRAAEDLLDDIDAPDTGSTAA